MTTMPPKPRRKATRPSFTDDPLWYKDAVVYQLHVKSFFDANNDGIGDFAGLIDKLDYIAELGVNTIWLLPFYPSPRRDDGYDIAAYKGVHADYGSLHDARRFVQEAHARGLRIITELVINHTSDQHPWFQRARKAKPGSVLRDFYVWSDSDTRYAGTRIIFCDTEKSNWTWDPVANAYYWHRFYSHQPDLNFDNPRVLKAVLGVMRFWLEIGVDGLRLDAVPYLVEREGTSNENLPETHAILKRIRAEIDATFPGRMLLAEANMWPEDVQQYFGVSGGETSERGISERLDASGDECHMAFHFPLMPRMYMAVAQEDRFPITDILRQTPDIPANCQWAIFLRNHDELTLEMVTDKERDYLWERYASDRRARLNLGIRRRLAPLLERDRRRIELLNSMLLSMPGTPVIYYGDEIGMGDNIHLGDRDGVRTPMQWSIDRNGGFSRADPASLVLPPVMDTLYGYQAVNVEAQARDPHSLLNWMRRMLAIRRQTRAFGRGTLRLLYPANRRILAYLREYQDAGGDAGGSERVLCVANMSRSAQAVELDLSAHAGCVPVEMVGGSAFPPIGQLPYLLTLPPYGFYWFVLASQAQLPPWHVPAPEPLPEYMTLVLRKRIEELLQPPIRTMLERDILPAWLAKRRWFGAKDEKIEAVRIENPVTLDGAEPPVLLTEVAVRTARGSERYLLPFGFISEDDTVSALPQQLALARVRRGRRVGFLTDAYAIDRFAHQLVDGLRRGLRLPAGDGELRFVATSKLATLELPADAEVRRMSTEQSNSSLVIAEKLMLKLIRRVSPGVHPEAEMGACLTERGYANIAPMYGELTHVAADGTPQVLAVMQGFMHNQGDGWTYTRNLLDRALADVVVAADGGDVDAASHDVEFAESALILGRRLASMHATLAQPSEDTAFAPERATAADCAAWAGAVATQLRRAFELLATRAAQGTELQGEVQALLAQQDALLARLPSLAAYGEGSVRTRIHGDLHLSQVLVSQGDVYFIDFEGEPARPLAERRAKASPLRDVAGMLRSFDYAAAMAARDSGAALSEAAQAQRQQLIARFLQVSELAFLTAYRETAASAAWDHGWQSHETERALLDLFLIDKAAYEIAYEAANRPDWLAVPLRGLARLAQRLLNGETNA